MIRVVHPGSDFYPSRIPYPGTRGQKGTGSLIRNTDNYFLFYLSEIESFYGFVAGAKPDKNVFHSL